MTLTITVSIKVNIIEVEFNFGCKIYRGFKKLLQHKDEEQFMQLTQKYYTFTSKNLTNIMEFLDYMKLLEEKMNAAKVIMTENEQSLLFLRMNL